MVSGVRKLLLELGSKVKVSGSLSNNARAIAEAFEKSFSYASIENFLLPLPKILIKIKGFCIRSPLKISRIRKGANGVKHAVWSWCASFSPQWHGFQI